MSFVSKIKTFAAASLFSVAGGIASAATVAALDVDGYFGLSDTTLVASGSFLAQDFGINPYLVADYVFSASLEVDGMTVFDDSFTVPDTSLAGLAVDIASALDAIDPAIIPFLTGVGDVIVGATPGPSQILPGLWFSFDIVPGSLSFTPTSIAGNFFTVLTTDLRQPIFTPQIPFSLGLTIQTDLAVIPLPASLPLLAAGFLGFAALRRRRKTS